MNSGRTHTVTAFPGEAAIFFSQAMGPIAESIRGEAILHPGRLPLDEVRAADEIRDEPPVGFEVDLPGRPHLDDPAAPHHRDRVRERQGLDPVVGHIDGGDRKLREKAPQLLARLLAELGVQVGEGLVEEDHLRLGDQGPGQGDALLLAAAELRRRPVLEPVELDEMERLGDLLPISSLGSLRVWRG